MLATLVVFCVIVGLCLVPRPIPWARLRVPLTVAGLLVGFALASWGLAHGFAFVGSVGERIESLGVPAPAIIVAPALALVLLTWLGGRRQRRTPLASGSPTSRFEADAGWYAEDWTRDASDPAQSLGTDGYRLELVGGPLAGRMARLRDSQFRLWVAEPMSGGELIVRGAIERPALQGVTLLGAYEFSHDAEAMTWAPATSLETGPARIAS
jgi:hypothetical protein